MLASVPRAGSGVKEFDRPTPIHRLSNLESALDFDGELWIKRDDGCGLRHGGNKPRKLEFLLGEALARGAGTVITFGTLGTHHGLATTICAGKLGLDTVLILVDEPVRDETRRNLLLCHAHGAELCYAGARRRATLLGAWNWLQHCDPLRRKFPYLIMPGGSTPRGAIGYVNAALELEDQVKAGELPEPDYIFVPVGSNGTMAGLGRHAPEIATAPPVRAQDVTIWPNYLGRGYAYPTPEARRAIERMAECEDIELEFVYTAGHWQI